MKADKPPEKLIGGTGFYAYSFSLFKKQDKG
jgi:hypothetical protein